MMLGVVGAASDKGRQVHLGESGVDGAKTNLQRYQDYVIRDGQLIGDFEGLYRDFYDPWLQSREDHVRDTRRQIALNWCARIHESSPPETRATRVLELGCGFGHLTSALTARSFAAIGVDVAAEAVRRARKYHPESIFLQRSISDEGLLYDLDPDIVVMAEVTWYVLDKLSAFVDSLRSLVASGRVVYGSR